MTSWLREMFHVEKPVIGMAHFPALPGTPRHDAAIGVAGMVERMRADVAHLLENRADAIMFCNEDAPPYTFRADFEAIAVMTRVITALRPMDRPFGVDFLWDPKAPLAIGLATGASFIREVVTGVYESDMGLWAPDAAALYCYRHQVGADHIRVFANVTLEFASPLGQRSVAQRARRAVGREIWVLQQQSC